MPLGRPHWTGRLKLGLPTIPIFDGHNDVLLRLDAAIDRFFERSVEGHIDLPRAREGGLAGGFCAIYTRGIPAGDEFTVRNPFLTDGSFPPTPSMETAQSYTLATIHRLLRLEEISQGQLKIIHSAADLEYCLNQGIFAALLHIEGAESIDTGFRTLEAYYQAGLRSIGPVWSRPNIFGTGVPFLFSHSPDTGPGLTAAGRDLVRECNHLRIVIDVSHLNEAGFNDVARLSDAPLIATHSNAWKLAPCSRNLTDRQLDAIKDSDGMVGINFAVGFLREDGAPEPETPLSEIVRHVDYLVNRVGIDRVGFGSDFDGAMIPAAIGDAAGLPRLIEALHDHGYDQAALRKLAHNNWLRVLRLTWGA